MVISTLDIEPDPEPDIRRLSSSNHNNINQQTTQIQNHQHNQQQEHHKNKYQYDEHDHPTSTSSSSNNETLLTTGITQTRANEQEEQRIINETAGNVTIAPPNPESGKEQRRKFISFLPLPIKKGSKKTNGNTDGDVESGSMDKKDKEIIPQPTWKQSFKVHSSLAFSPSLFRQ